MSTSPLTLVVFIKAKQATKQRLKDVLLDVTAKTRVEAGCINYDLHIARDDDSLFIIHETWQDKAAHDSHMNQPHLKNFLSLVEELVEGEVKGTWCRKL